MSACISPVAACRSTTSAWGESIAVNGVCLTVIAFDGDGFQADASNETLALTRSAAWTKARRSIWNARCAPTDAWVGTWSVGHVDGVGRVLDIREDARAQRWRSPRRPRCCAMWPRKARSAWNGVSLTVNEVDAAGFEVALIPHTVLHTVFAHTPVGAAVNLEIDLVARYVERLLAKEPTHEIRTRSGTAGGKCAPAAMVVIVDGRGPARTKATW